MGIIFVDELGEVEIEGDVPTPDEADLILQTIEAVERQRGAAPSPAPMAAQPSAGPQPTWESAIAADVARDASEATSTLVGGAVKTGSGVVRGLLEAPFAAAEAVGLPAEEPQKFFQAWREEEEETFKPSISLKEADSAGDYANWVSEGLATVVPGMVAAGVSLPAYAVSLVADTARERARADGRDEITVGDLSAAVGSSAFVALSERLGLKGLLGKADKGLPRQLGKAVERITERKSVPGRMAAAAATEAGTELAQEGVQYLAERAGTKTGASMEELAPRLTEAAVLGGIVGAGGRGLREGQVAAARKAGVLPEPIYDKIVGDIEKGGDQSVEQKGEPEDAEVAAIIEERDPTVPGEYTDIASPLEADAVDIQVEAKSKIDAIEGLEKSLKEAQDPTPPAPPRPDSVGPDVKPVKPRRKFEPPDPIKEAWGLLQKHADPETLESDMLEAAMMVIGRRRRKVANIDDDNSYFAAQKRHLDPYIKQIADRMGMTQGDVDAMRGYQRMSYADTIKSAEEAGLDPRLTPYGVDIPKKLDSIIQRTTDTAYAPTATEEAAMHWALMLQRKHRAEILSKADPSDPAAKADLDALDQQALRTAVALRRAGTEIGRAMRYRQFVVSPVMDLLQSQAEAAIRYGGKLDPKIKQRLKNLWDKAEAIEAQGKRLKKEAEARLGSAMARLETAKKKLSDADRIAEAAEDLKSAARAEAKKKRKKPTKKGIKEASKELDDSIVPILVKPLRKSKEQREMERAMKEVMAARGEMIKADAKIREGQAEKNTAAKKATTSRVLTAWEKAFGGAVVLKASGDLSAFGRQALPLVMANPLLAINTIPKIVRVASWKPEARARALAEQEGILSEAYQDLRDLGGVEITEVEGRSNINGSPITQGEETYMFRAFESGLFSQLVIPSKNTFALTLNILRAKNFDALVDQMAAANGIELDGLTPKQRVEVIKKELPAEDLKAAGLMINVITGRASQGAGTGVAAEIMRRTMFAPRFTISRLEAPYRIAQLYAGAGPFRHMSVGARAALLSRANKSMSLYASLFLLTVLAAGDEDDTWQEALSDFFNPQSASFLKARVGDYHFDMFPGVPATLRYLLPIGLLPSALLPEKYEENLSEYGRGLWQLANNKAAPLLSAMRTLSGYDWRGGEIKAEEELGQIGRAIGVDVPDGPVAAAMYLALRSVGSGAVPISIENAAELAWGAFTDKEKDIVQQAVPALAEFLGVGLAHFDPEKKKKGQQRRTTRSMGDRQRRLERY